MAVNVKMGVDIGGFKSGIREGQTILKGLNAEMKSAEAEFKATGNAEKLMSDKTKNLNSQLRVQKGVVDQAKKALEEMDKQGIQPSDKDYQKLYATMMNAQAGMYETQAALNSLGASAQQAASGADQLTSSVNSIGKKISLDQVISGINSVTSGLEKAASKALELGETIFSAVMDKAKWADDTATMAMMYGIDVETFQRMQKLVTNGMDTSVEAILNAQSRLKKGIGGDSKAVLDTLEELGIGLREGNILDPYSWKTKDPDQMFWDVGKAIMSMGDAYKQEAAAQTLFGRSWKELVPLFDVEHGGFAGLEEYNAALNDVKITSEEDVNALAELNDKVSELKGNLDTLSTDILATLAPALTEGANALNGMLESLLDYLKTPDGQKMLTDLGNAVSGLFDDLGKIDPQQVIEGFTGVFNTIIDSLKWLDDNKGTVVSALEFIVGGWAALKLTGGVLDIIKLIDGITGLTAGSTAAASAGSAAGASWAGAFASAAKSAIVSAAPWLATFLGITALSVAPAVGAQKKDEETWKAKQALREAAAELADGENKPFLQTAAAALGPHKKENGSYDTDVTGLFLNMNPTDDVYGLLTGLKDRKNQQKAELYNLLSRRFTPEAGNTWNALNNFWNGAEMDPVMVNALLQDITDALAEDTEKKAKIPMEPEVPENAAEQVAEQVGEVNLPAKVIVTGLSYGSGGGGGGKGVFVYDPIVGMMRPKGFANGIWSVPYDGMLAQLHRGERVTPAREVSSRNYSSNLYVENMNMNNGQDAAGLAAAMAAAQRRTMNGYGS